MRIFSPPSIAALVGAVVVLTCGSTHAGMLYLALGDSNAFGNDESTPSSTAPNNGDQGYVHPFADYLGALNGGVRPTVLNLAVSGELSTSFLSGVAPVGWPYRAPALNTNYIGTTAPQNTLMIGALDAARLAGNSVTVSFNIGTNDFAYLLSMPAFQTASPAQQQAMFLTLLNQVTAVYEGVLGEIQQHSPGAKILLPGFFNGLVPTNPSYSFYEQATLAADQVIQQLAPSYGATYVDFYSIIHGNAATLANASGSNHLNQAGYAAVARALDAAVVPEPASAVLLGLGTAAVGCGVVTRRRRTA